VAGSVTWIATNRRRRCSPEVVGSYFGASPWRKQVGTLDLAFPDQVLQRSRHVFDPMSQEGCQPKGSFGPDSGPRVAVYEYALAVAGSATPRRPVPMNSTISAAAIHKRPASMKASK
jgi:hypothetical protein